jgi:glutamate N-acetyltransferase/amino-acid N-acetyltransferase
VRGGVKAEFDEATVRELLSRDPIEISIDLGVGRGQGLALGCDLTEGYIKENAAYSSS